MAFSGYPEVYNVDEHVNADDPTGYIALMFDEYTSSLQGDNPTGSGSAVGISAKTEALEGELRYVDALYNPDTVLELDNGPKGELWDVNEGEACL